MLSVISLDDSQDASAAAGTSALPAAVVLHILSMLPSAAQAYSARHVCKATHEVFQDCTSISASCKELPLWVLQQMHATQHEQQQQVLCQSTAPSTGQTMCQSQQQLDTKLLASRAAAEDQAGVQWLVSQGCTADDASICRAAARTGHLPLLQFLRELNPPCSWDSSAATAAAAAGHMPVLRHMLVDADPACDCDVWTTRAAARAGSLEALQLLQQQGQLMWDNWAAKVSIHWSLQAIQHATAWHRCRQCTVSLLHVVTCTWWAPCLQSALLHIHQAPTYVGECQCRRQLLLGS
jgi:hypothetical protein